MEKGRWRQGKGAKEFEEGCAAAEAPSMPGEAETPSAFTTVATEGAFAVGGNSDAAAEDGADIESCMLKKFAFFGRKCITAVAVSAKQRFR